MTFTYFDVEGKVFNYLVMGKGFCSISSLPHCTVWQSLSLFYPDNNILAKRSGRSLLFSCTDIFLWAELQVAGSFWALITPNTRFVIQEQFTAQKG